MLHSIGWKPDKSLKTPIYEQIKVFIIQKISSGEWFIGYRLPSQRDLADCFQVNRSTVKTALEDLVADGVLATHGKGGTLVNNNTWSLFNKSLSPDWLKYINSGSMNPNYDITHSIHDYEFGTSLIRMSTGELSPDLFPQDIINEVLHEMSQSNFNLSYNHPNGLLELREALVEYYRKVNVNIKPSQILIVSGALQAIHLISVGLLPKGSSIMCERPSYLYSLNLFESSGVSLFGVASDENGINIDDLEKVYKKVKTPIYYTIPYFQNPMGMYLNDAKRYELLSTCQKLRLPVIEDDTYRELYYSGERPLPLKASDENQSVIHIGSVSKTLCAGLRTGWIIGQEEVINRLADIKMQIDYGTSSLSQMVVQKLISSGYYEENLNRLRERLKDKRDKMLTILESDFFDIADWNVPSGGFYIWLTIKKKIELKKVFEGCIKEGVIINPGYMYDKNNKNAIRLSFSYINEKEMIDGLEVLKNIILKSLKEDSHNAKV